MKNFYAFVVLAGILLAGNGYADTLKDAKSVRNFCDNVMGNVAKNDLTGAFNSLKPYVAISSTEVDSAAVQSRVQREQYGQRYGESTGFEFIDEKRVGESLLRLRYIEKTRKHALPWVFHFYRTEEGWTLNAFSWNDQYEQLFVND